MEAFIPFLLLIGLFALTALYGHFQLRAWVREVEAFSRLLEGGTRNTELGLFQRITSVWARGTLEGAEVSLSFERRGSGKHAYQVAVYEVRVDNPVADFKAEDEGMLDGLWRWLGVSTTKQLSPDVKLTAGGAGERLFQENGQPHDVVRRILALPGEQRGVRLTGRRLLLERRASSTVVAADDLLRTFQLLVGLSKLCSRQRLPEGSVKVRGRTPLETFAWTEGGQAALCPFCRDRVDTGSEGAAACERCGTVHHAACLEEAAGCTIFGCRTGEERARARER